MRKMMCVLLMVLAVLACNTNEETVYKSDNLSIKKVGPHSYVHTSFLNTEQWGKVPCNGLLVLSDGKALVCDSPSEQAVAEELINWIENEKEAKIQAMVPTHFHVDCIGGAQAFINKRIPVLAYEKTQELLKDKNVAVRAVPGTFEMMIGGREVECRYFGAGHTIDNIVVAVPGDEVLFGGCLVKAAGAKKGNLEDANEAAWSGTVQKVAEAYPTVKTVIPGHGATGGKELLDYTITLFK